MISTKKRVKPAWLEISIKAKSYSSEKKYLSILYLAICLLLTHSAGFASFNNGFDLTVSLIDSNKIFAGGPPKDGIPAINTPKFIDPEKASYLQGSDRILGVEINGVSRAYPIAILNWHEIVNDQIDNTYFAVTYCPLCGTGVVFSSRVEGQNLDFGVSGLLYNSDVLLYDLQSESLWSQILGKAVTGKFAGQSLEILPVTHTNWSDWQKNHPQTQVLSDQTGYSRDYRRNPYQGYEKSRNLYFQVAHTAPASFHPKERVLGLEINHQFKAYPFSEIDKVGKSRITENFAGKQFTIHWDRENQRAMIMDASQNPVPTIEGFWFAWFAFHPDTEVFKPDK